MAEHPDFRASLNVSPLSAIDPDWWSTLTSLLRLNTTVAERLTIEITETVAIQDIDELRSFVARVKDFGCRIAIDDFGAGYTSFRNLRKLGVDMIKIDGAFIENMIASEDDRAFVLTLLDLARRLKLKTVAERVQREDIARALADYGCDYLQGESARARVAREPAAEEAQKIGGASTVVVRGLDPRILRLTSFFDRMVPGQPTMTNQLYFSPSPRRSMRFCISSI